MPVGVQCPASLPHYVSFPAIGIGSGVLGFRPYWCPSTFPSLSILGVFHSLLSAIGFQSCFFFTADVYRHPFGQPFTYSLFRRFSRLGTGSGTRCCGPRGGTAVRMEQKTRSKFLPLAGVETRTLASSGRGCCHY